MKPYHQLYKIFIIIIIINLISVPAAKISAGSYSDAFIYGVMEKPFSKHSLMIFHVIGQKYPSREWQPTT